MTTGPELATARAPDVHAEPLARRDLETLAWLAVYAEPASATTIGRVFDARPRRPVRTRRILATRESLYESGRRRLVRLVDRGLVSRVARGLYVLTERGRLVAALTLARDGALRARLGIASEGKNP